MMNSTEFNPLVVYYKEQYFEIILDERKRVVKIKKQKTGREVKEGTLQWLKVAQVYLTLTSYLKECNLRQN